MLQGQEVQNINIVDLVNDALRQRKTFIPPGWEHFARELRRLNAPKELVGNMKYWETAASKVPAKTPPRRRLATQGLKKSKTKSQKRPSSPEYMSFSGSDTDESVW